MITFGKIIKRIKRPKKPNEQRGVDYNNFVPYEGDHKRFRTSQDTAGGVRKTILQQITQRRRSRRAGIQGNDFRSTHSDNKKKGLLIPCAASIMVLVLLGYFLKGIFIDLSSDIKYFQIQKIDILGCKVTSQEEIREIGGFTFGTSLFGIRPKEVEDLLKSHVWIREAKLERKWPNKLFVRVWEHVPTAMITKGEPGQEKLYYVNKRGICFSSVQAGEDIDFPVITGLQGFHEEERKKILDEALYFLKLAGMNNPNLPAQLVSEINIDEKEGLVIYLVDHPFPIYFGREDVKKKYRQLRKVLEILYKKQKNQTKITQVKYIRLDYLTNKVLVAQSGSG